MMEIRALTDAQFDALKAAILSDRQAAMAIQYGETCTTVRAAEILGCSRSTISAMLKGGQIERACEGKAVDVRSLARFIEAKESGKPIRRKKQWV